MIIRMMDIKINVSLQYIELIINYKIDIGILLGDELKDVETP